MKRALACGVLLVTGCAPAPAGVWPDAVTKLDGIVDAPPPATLQPFRLPTSVVAAGDYPFRASVASPEVRLQAALDPEFHVREKPVARAPSPAEVIAGPLPVFRCRGVVVEQRLLASYTLADRALLDYVTYDADGTRVEHHVTRTQPCPRLDALTGETVSGEWGAEPDPCDPASVEQLRGR